MEKIRLQKYFTDCGIMSRRAAEREIADGNVKVNGITAEIGQSITVGVDVVEYNGEVVEMPEHTSSVCIMLNKPQGYITSMSDDRGRRCVTELLSGVNCRVYPVGRLDMYSEGLLLLTNDGELANALTHPRHGIPKIYRVTTVGVPSDEQIERLRRPMNIDGYEIMPVETKVHSETDKHVVLEMRLYEGRNRQIRKMCDQVGIRIKRLQRIAIGEIHLGRLPLGKYRYLTAVEIQYLKESSNGGKTNA